MIVAITLRNFRGHKDKTIKFGPGVNYLVGRNEVGKTTICDAIAFCFYGTDQYGNRNPDHLITFGEEATQVVLTTDKAVFDRVKNRNSTSTVSLTRNGLPPIKMNQTELTALLGMSFDLFASLYNAGFFMELPQLKKHEVIGQIAKLDRRALLQSLVPGVEIHAKIKFENLKIDAQVMASERRIAQNQLSSDQGALAQVETQLQEFSQELTSLDLESTKKEIESLTAHADLFDLYASDLLKYQAAMTRAREAHDDNQRLDAERRKTELELKALGEENPALKDSTMVRLAQLSGEYENLYMAGAESLPQVPVVVELPEGNCPQCGQLVPPKLRESAANAREKALNDYNRRAREIQNRNDARASRMETLRKEIDGLKEHLQTLETDRAVKQAQRELLQEKLKSLVTKEVVKPNPPQKPTGDEKSIRDRLADLRARFHAQQLFNQKREKLAASERLFRTSVEQKIKLVENLKQLEDALLRMPELEVRQTLEMLKTPGVEMMFLEDELVVTDAKRVPYQSLSTGRRLKISVELCKTFQRLVPRAPQFYFIDNVDLMDTYRDILPRGQVFVAKVDPSCADIQVVAE